VRRVHDKYAGLKLKRYDGIEFAEVAFKIIDKAIYFGL